MQRRPHRQPGALVLHVIESGVRRDLARLDPRNHLAPSADSGELPRAAGDGERPPASIEIP